MKRILTIACLLSFALSASAQINHQGLDLTFGTGGMTITSYQFSDTRGNTVAIQPDGKIIAGGYSDAGAIVIRYNTDGTLDQTFSSFGIFITPTVGSLRKVIVQPDNKILIAGYQVMRLMPNGTVDQSFGITGQVETSFGAQQMALQPDGKIIIAGEYLDNIFIARFHNNGSIDSSFGINGIVKTFYGSNAETKGIGLMSDGRIVVAGNGDNPDYPPYSLTGIYVTRYLPDGVPDTSFNHTGMFFYMSDTLRIAYCSTMQLQTDGKIMIAGSAIDAGYVMRLNTDDSLDVSFGQRGIFKFPYRSIGFESLALTPSGKIIVGGDTNWDNFITARIKPDGSSLDSSFGRDGLIITNPTGFTNNRFGALTIQADGKIIAVGQSPSDGIHFTDGFVTLRYLPDAPTAIPSIPIQAPTIQVYPNPASSFINISSSIGALIIKTEIISPDGRLVKSYTYPSAPSAQLPLNGLAPGVYTLKTYYITGQQPSLQKLLISTH